MSLARIPDKIPTKSWVQSSMTRMTTKRRIDPATSAAKNLARNQGMNPARSPTTCPVQSMGKCTATWVQTGGRAQVLQPVWLGNQHGVSAE